MIELNCNNYISYIFKKLKNRYNVIYNNFNGNTTLLIIYKDTLLCKIYNFDGRYDSINIYHLILDSDIVYGNVRENCTNLKRIIISDILYQKFVIDKIIDETILYIGLSIKKVDLNYALNHELEELTSINRFDNLEYEIRTEKLKFISELN